MFLFLVSEKGTEKAELRGGCPLTYPAASRANADAPRRLIRTRLLNRKNSAFAAIKEDGENREANKVRDRSSVRLALLEIAAAPTAQARI